MKIELIFDSTCPNVEATRQAIKNACSMFKLDLKWKEWDRSDTDAPEYVRKFGSPTVLVNGKDIDGHFEASMADCCRLYGVRDGHSQGAPSAETIADAIRTSFVSCRADKV